MHPKNKENVYVYLRKISYCGEDRPKHMSYRHCFGKRLKSRRTFQTSNLQVFRAICEIRRRLANEWRRFWDAFTCSQGDCGKTPHVKTNIKNLSQNDVPWRFLSWSNGLCWSQSISFPIRSLTNNITIIPCGRIEAVVQLTQCRLLVAVEAKRAPWDWQRVIHHYRPSVPPRCSWKAISLFEVVLCYSLWGRPKELAAARYTIRWTLGQGRTKAGEAWAMQSLKESASCIRRRNISRSLSRNSDSINW